MNIALLGFGTVGFGVYEIAEKTDGLDITYVLDLKKHEGISAKSVTDITPILEDSSVDTVVELIGGLHPAYEFVKGALLAGKNVVTANKFLICEYYEELNRLARENGVALRYTASVGGGIPWLVNLERIKRISPVKSITGIFNGTTNFILDGMHKNGADFSDMLKEAQRLGYAEADPSADIDALDTVRKIIISANIAFDRVFAGSTADVFGIRNITFKDIESAEKEGMVCRLLASAIKTDAGYSVFAEPTFISKDSPFASVGDSFNRISVDSELEGEAAFFGYGAGRYPTAYAVAGDLLDVKEGSVGEYGKTEIEDKADNSLTTSRYYVRTADEKLLGDIIDRTFGNGYITKEISVKEMHSLAKKILEKDGGFFFAAVR
jgi:homoserine dehydrogenase